MIFAESEFVELKSEIVGDVCKEVIAFANTNGGTLFIGVADDGRVVGVENPDKVTLQLNNIVRDTIKPDVTMFVRYETREIDGKKIVVATIQKGTNRPYYLGGKGLKPGGVYVRNGVSSDPATETAIRKMIKETDGDSFEDMRSLEQNLTFKSATEEFKKRNVAFDQTKMKSLGLLSSDGVYCNAAALLSDQCVRTIKSASFVGLDKSVFQDRREFSGSLFQQMEDAYAYLDLWNRTKATIKGLYRVDSRDYPEEALRESLVNLIVHRDYSYSASSLINVYSDRVEFVSIGGLPGGIALEDVMLGLSVCRNPKLAAVFYRLKLIEAYGTGLPKIMRAYADVSSKPKIEATSNAFKITLPNRNLIQNISVDNLDEREKRILSSIESSGAVTRSEVDVLLGVSSSTSSRLLQKMVAEGLIYQECAGRKTQYKKS